MKIILILCSCFFLNLFTMDSTKRAVVVPELDLELAAKALARMQKSEPETLQNSQVIQQMLKLSGQTEIHPGVVQSLDSTVSLFEESDTRAYDSFTEDLETISLSSSGESIHSLGKAEKRKIEDQVRIFLNNAYVAQDKKQHGLILWGKRISVTAVIVVGIEILLNILEASGIGVGAYFACR